MSIAVIPVPRLFTFIGDVAGVWRTVSVTCVAGAPIPPAPGVTVVAGSVASTPAQAWTLRGITSNERYVMREEKIALVGKQEGLGRKEATHAALIPIRKTAAWWALPQDERRRIFEEQSRHIAIGMRYLPAIARRLHHCRDLGPDEPFDFITWFEYASTDARAFDELVRVLRESPEWAYIDREIDIRLVHVDG